MFFLGVLSLVYIVSFYVDREKRKLDQNKKPLVITSRVKRLLFTVFIIYLVPIIFLIIDHSLKEYVLLVIAVMAFIK